MMSDKLKLEAGFELLDWITSYYNIDLDGYNKNLTEFQKVIDCLDDIDQSKTPLSHISNEEFQSIKLKLKESSEFIIKSGSTPDWWDLAGWIQKMFSNVWNFVLAFYLVIIRR